MNKHFPLICALILSLNLYGCTKSGGSDSSSGDSDGGGESGSTSCGVLINGSVEDSIDISSTELVGIERVISINSVAVRRTLEDGSTSGALLYKIFGIAGAQAGKAEAALNTLTGLLGSSAYLQHPQKDSCSGTLVQGGSGEVGQFFTRSGESVTDILIRRGLVIADTSGACGENKLASCYAGLQRSDQDVAGELDSMLWKPDSDSDGHLAVHTGPSGTTVIVNGEVGVNQGGGNGYGSLARFSKSGCAYASPKIQVIDGSSGLAYTVGGQITFTLDNPCGRHCLQGGVLVACSK